MYIPLPKVSVVTITYGHQDYILDTIKSVLMQDYSGEIEFIIANDNSPDDTHRVVTEFLNTNFIPARFEIKYTKHDKNLGMMQNFTWALNQCKGKYIAMCEGDDYWTDPLKLQKQVDFLEENHDFVATFHQVSQLNFDGTISKPVLIDNYETNFYDAIQGSFGSGTLSTVVRADGINFELFKKAKKSKIGDIYLMVGASLKGKGYIFNENMGVYRHHAGGASKNYNTLFYYHSRLGIFEYLEESLDEFDTRKAFYRAFAARFTKQECIWVLKTGNYHLLNYVYEKYQHFKKLSSASTNTFEEKQFREQFRRNHKSMNITFFEIVKSIIKFITKRHYIEKSKTPYA